MRWVDRAGPRFCAQSFALGPFMTPVPLADFAALCEPRGLPQPALYKQFGIQTALLPKAGVVFVNRMETRKELQQLTARHYNAHCFGFPSGPFLSRSASQKPAGCERRAGNGPAYKNCTGIPVGNKTLLQAGAGNMLPAKMTP